MEPFPAQEGHCIQSGWCGRAKIMSTPQASISLGNVPTASLALFLRRWFPFRVFLGTLLVAGVFACARLNPPDPDMWWHLAVGERILQSSGWPTVDSYSYTVAGHPWIAYEWLGEVLIASAARLAGMPGLVCLLLILSCTFLLLLFYASDLRSANLKAAFVACAAVLPAAAFFFTVRPQLIGYIFLLITLIWLRRYRQGRQRSLWVLPFVFIIWVNTHGSFAFGLFVLGVYWFSGLVEFRVGGIFAERWTPGQRRHLAIIFLLCVLGLTITPYGTRLAAYPLEMAFLQPVNIASIQEWQPLSPYFQMGKVFIALLLGFFLLHLLCRLSYRLEELALLFLAIYAASVHRRFLLLLVVVLAPTLAMLLVRWMPPYQSRKDRHVLNLASVILLGVGLVLFFPSAQAIHGVVSQSYPDQAVAYMRAQGISGRVLNEYGWGGYLIWSLRAQQKVFIDGRADIYDHGGVLADYMSMTHLKPNTLFLLQKYGISSCLLRRDAPLRTLLAARPDWEMVYQDRVSVLFVRRSTPVRPGQARGLAASYGRPQSKIILF